MTPHDLIQKHLDASLTAAEAAELAAAMAENPALAEEFAAASRMDAAVSAVIREDSRTALYTRRFQRTAPPASAQRKTACTGHARRIATAAAIATLLGGAWWALPRRAESPALPLAEKKKSAPKVMESAAPAPAFTGGSRAVAATDSAALRRTLRQFQGTGGNVRSQPVSQALASLEATWKEHAPKDMAAIPIRLSDNVRQRYTQPEDEPLVSLEIPGASLLANLNLLAAQAGLKAVITSEAVTLEPEPRTDDGIERTWTLPLDQPTLAAFIDRAGRETALASWMPKPEPIVLTGSGITQPVFATRRWKEVADSKLLPEHPPALVEVIREFPYPTEFDPPSVPNDGVRITTPDMQIEADSVSVTTNGNGVTMTNARFTELRHTELANDQNELELQEQLSAADPASVHLADQHTMMAEVNEDGYIIDLNLAPEVVEFEGFINYGSPIQAIAMPSLDHPATLLSLLAAHGLPSGASYDAATGQLTAKATLTQLRAASAAMDAVREAANAGFQAQLRVIEWPGQSPVDAGARLGMVSERAWQAEVKKFGGQILISSHKTFRSQKGTDSFTLPESTEPRNNTDPYTSVTLTGCKAQAGTAITATVSIESLRLIGNEIIEGDRHPVMQTDTGTKEHQWANGDWLIQDFPAKGTAPARTLLLCIEPAQVAPGP